MLTRRRDNSPRSDRLTVTQPEQSVGIRHPDSPPGLPTRTPHPDSPPGLPTRTPHPANRSGASRGVRSAPRPAHRPTSARTSTTPPASPANPIQLASPAAWTLGRRFRRDPSGRWCAHVKGGWDGTQDRLRLTLSRSSPSGRAAWGPTVSPPLVVAGNRAGIP